MDLVPETLRQAHEDGEVVFFCGAGISVPAGMPSFEGLVKTILNDLCSDPMKAPLPWSSYKDKKYDEVLDILERHEQGGFGKEVRKRVCELLNKRARTLKMHLTLVRLSDLDKPEGRLITTNFDSLFERAISKVRREEKSSHIKLVDIAPTLPPPKLNSWNTLVHLHGKLDQSPDNKNLILTTADFGAAYLLDRWASRFVTELFRNFHVIFIGYSINDPTMRYLMSALAAARENREHYKDAFAFAPYGGEHEPNTREIAIQEWKVKGVRALAYVNTLGDHDILWKNLGEWSDDHRGGLLSRRRVAAKYGKYPPTGKDDLPLLELTWALKDPGVSSYFAKLEGEDRPYPGWIEPLQNNGLLNLPIGTTIQGDAINAPLVSRVLPDHLRLNDATYQLGFWIAQCLDSQQSLDWALNQGGVLHRELRQAIQHQLRNDQATGKIPEGLKVIWRILASDEYAHSLSANNYRSYPYYPKLSATANLAKRDFLQRLRPIPVFSVKPDYYRDRGETDPERPSSYCEIKIHLIGIEANHDIETFRKASKDWGAAIATMAEEITTLLHDAMDWLAALDLAAPEHDITHLELRSISPHEQNRHSATWAQLIELARDSFDALTIKDPTAASRLARRWKCLDYPIFRRLALYAATGGSDA